MMGDGGRDAHGLQVFISYRRSDSGPFARLVYDAVVQRFGRDDVFYDIDSIAPGRDFVDVLDESLDRADVLLVIIGPGWLDARDELGERRLDDPSDYVRMEVERALTRRAVRVIPVLVGGAHMPASPQLPEGLAPLARRQAASLIDVAWSATMATLLNVLERIRDDAREHLGTATSTSASVQPATVDGPPRLHSPTSSEPARPGKSSRSRLRRRAAAITAALTVAGGAFAIAEVLTTPIRPIKGGDPIAHLAAAVRSDCSRVVDPPFDAKCELDGHDVKFVSFVSRDDAFGAYQVAAYDANYDRIKAGAPACSTSGRATPQPIEPYRLSRCAGSFFCAPSFGTQDKNEFYWIPHKAKYYAYLELTGTFKTAYSEWQRIVRIDSTA